MPNENMMLKPKARFLSFVNWASAGERDTANTVVTAPARNARRSCGACHTKVARSADTAETNAKEASKVFRRP